MISCPTEQISRQTLRRHVLCYSLLWRATFDSLGWTLPEVMQSLSFLELVVLQKQVMVRVMHENTIWFAAKKQSAQLHNRYLAPHGRYRPKYFQGVAQLLCPTACQVYLAVLGKPSACKGLGSREPILKFHRTFCGIEKKGVYADVIVGF